MVELRETTNRKTGARRYFIDGRRISRDTYDWHNIRAIHRDTFCSWTRGNVRIATCYATFSENK